MLISRQQLVEFEEQGFIILDGVFSVDDLNAFGLVLRRTIRAHIDKAKSQSKDFPDIDEGREVDLGIKALEKLNHDFISDISDFVDRSPEILRLASTPAVYKSALQFLKCDLDAPSYITNLGIVLAMPFDRGHSYGWHKDTYYTLPYSNYVQMWAPLIERSTTKLGTLEVCPGSHLAGASEQHAVDGVPNRHRYRVNPEAIKQYSIKRIEIEVGQVLLFDGGLAHRSGSNTSNRARFSIVSVYHQVENQKIRPMIFSGQYKGKSIEEYFHETCGEVRPEGNNDSHFSNQ